MGKMLKKLQNAGVNNLTKFIRVSSSTRPHLALGRSTSFSSTRVLHHQHHTINPLCTMAPRSRGVERLFGSLSMMTAII
jgi:hypothetical protein